VFNVLCLLNGGFAYLTVFKAVKTVADDLNQVPLSVVVAEGGNKKANRKIGFCC